MQNGVASFKFNFRVRQCARKNAVRCPCALVASRSSDYLLFLLVNNFR